MSKKVEKGLTDEESGKWHYCQKIQYILNIGQANPGIALTGTSVTPARSLMPAIFAGGDALAQVWIFIVGPLIGGALAAVIYGALED